MNTIEKAYLFFRVYKGLNLHYKSKSKYDYSMYGPYKRVMAPADFEVSGERFPFIQLTNHFYHQDQLEGYLSWIYLKEGSLPFYRNIVRLDWIEQYKRDVLTIKNGFAYNFDLFLNDLNINHIKTNGRDYPEIIDKLFALEVFPEFFVVLDQSLKLSDQYANIFKNDILFNDKLDKYLRYRKTVTITNFNFYKNKLISKLKENN